MTNTTSVDFNTALHFTLEATYRRATTAEQKAEEVLLSGDYAYLAAWKMEGLVKIQAALAVLTVGKEHGPEAMAARLVDFLVASPTSSDAFANAVTIAQASVARDLLAEFRRYLPAQVVLDRL